MEIGVTKAIRKLEKKYSGRRLKESTIREWVKRYKAELKNKHKKEDH
jgi:oligoribonuclease (3'-5' exoribonuclease)